MNHLEIKLRFELGLDTCPSLCATLVCHFISSFFGRLSEWIRCVIGVLEAAPRVNFALLFQTYHDFQGFRFEMTGRVGTASYALKASLPFSVSVLVTLVILNQPDMAGKDAKSFFFFFIY